MISVDMKLDLLLLFAILDLPAAAPARRWVRGLQAPEILHAPGSP